MALDLSSAISEREEGSGGTSSVVLKRRKTLLGSGLFLI